ncbi:DUF5057 domain-containing protein [Paenibacillus tepidiphilus]|uniref:DUF5057 domain-containing protein n=1 Tax=Paenibacillus tepidiphilus TaxID=2608683 RepID=UPI0013A558E4|nr:DUF5057 domain-containing protein [Paenibacillus tepidiphilus]
MEIFKRRKLVFLSGAALSLLLVFLLVQWFSADVEASDNSYPIRILEITDPTNSSLGTDGSELDELKKLPNVTIDTVTMKKFVSLREDWDGKYDAVYIGLGEYTPKAVSTNGSSDTKTRTDAHNTSAVENDITRLKAKELTEYYINKGLYVFFREETFSAQAASSAKQGNLYNSFNTYRTGSSKANVVFLDATGFNNLAPEIKSGTSPFIAGLTQRPRLTISNTTDIKSYLTTPNYTYAAGDKLNFSIKMSNTPNLPASPIRVKLYMNVDSSLPMAESNVVATEVLSTPTGTLSYTLPATYSGPLYWKLEVNDTTTGFKDFDSGVIRFRGLKPVIKVLQVMPAGKTGSSLLNTSNMKTQYLSNPDYEIQIEARDMAWFNDYISKKASSNDKTSGLNGVYDMVVFGFQDQYDRVTNPMISKDAALAVKAFAEETKQSIMLTHDTIYNDPANPTIENYTNKVPNTNYWSYYFHNLVGQDMPRTYLGGNAVATSKTVVPVNNGLLTQYPFNLSSVTMSPNQSRYAVALTHDQFFPLNLERADVIPWYNISGSSRDVNDSRNHFYTYSVGNITFSGTGHTSTNFPEWEQMLFVNTMYRAFVGANHAPEITVKTPTDNKEKPSYQDKITVSYTVKDYDFEDKQLTTSLQFKVGDTPVSGYSVDNKAVWSGETVTFNFDNPLPEGGMLTIEITVKDTKGAAAIKTVNVPITRIDSNLAISRTVSSAAVERDTPTAIQYTVTPNPVPYLSVDSEERGIEQLVITNVKFEETFPANLEVSGSGEFTRTGSLAEGYTLTRDLGTITYQLTEVNGLEMYIPQNSSAYAFSLNVIPKVKQSYLMDNSKITFEDIHAAPVATATPTSTPSSSPTPLTTPVSTPAASFPGSSAPVNALGLANDYSIFMLGDITFLNNGFTNTGRMAAGGHVSIGSFDLGTGLGENPTGATIVANGNLQLSTNGGTLRGKAYYGGTVTVPGYMSGQTEKMTAPNSYIDFNSVGNSLISRSNGLSTLSKTADTKYDSNGSVELKGERSDLNVFYIKAEAARELHSITIAAPAESTVLINIAGTANQFKDGSLKITDLNGVTVSGRSRVIYNFFEANSLSILQYGDVQGTIFAPLADISFTGNLYGSFIGRSIRELNGGHFISMAPFTGTFPDTPAATATPSPTMTPTQTLTPAPTATSPAASAKPRETKTLYFSPLTLEGIVRVSGISVNGTDIRIGNEIKLFPVITPEDANNQNVSWQSDNPLIATVDAGTGVVKGISVGETTVTVTASDGSKTSATATIRVISPNLSISGPGSAKVNQSIDLSAIYNTIQETVTGYAWSIQNSNNNADKAAVTSVTDDNSTVRFQASQSGTYTVIVKVTTDANPDGVLAVKAITVGLNSLRIQAEEVVYLNNKITLRVVPDPLTANNEHYEWSLANADELQYGGFVNAEGRTVATLTTSGNAVEFKGTGVKEGIDIVVKAAGITSAAHPVSVVDEPGLMFSPDTQGTISVGKTLEFIPNQNLFAKPYGPLSDSIISRLQWSIAGGTASAIHLSSNGVVTGITPTKPGEPVQIQVKYKTFSGVDQTAVYTLTVRGPETSGDNRY